MRNNPLSRSYSLIRNINTGHLNYFDRLEPVPLLAFNLEFKMFLFQTSFKFKAQQVVSIDLFWVFFLPFSCNGVYVTSFISISCLSNSNIGLKRLVRMLYTHTQCSFVSHTHIYKPCSPLSLIIKKT